MSGHLRDPGTRATLADALSRALPEVSPERLQAALDAAIARVVPPPSRVVDEIIAGADPDQLTERIREAEELFRQSAEWEQLVDLHVARLSGCYDAGRRASILIELALLFEHEMNDLDRAFTARLNGFAEQPQVSALAELERLAGETGRWSDLALRLDSIAADDLDADTAATVLLSLAAISRDRLGDAAGALLALERAFAAAPRRPAVLRALADAYGAAGRLPDALDLLGRLVDVIEGDSERAWVYRELAAGWEHLGLVNRAAECHEWVLSFAPDDANAYDQLTRLYRGGGRWRQLIDTLGRRATALEPAERAPLFLEIAALYEHQLSDDDGAIDFYQAADDARPGSPEVMAALARLYQRRDAHDDAIATMERLVASLPAGRQRAQVLQSAAAISWRALRDGDSARDLLVRARRSDPDYGPAVDSLVDLHRERGELAAAIELLEQAAGRPALAAQRARMLADAGELAMILGEDDRAIELLAGSYASNGSDRTVALALCELLWQARRDDELVPLLESVCDELTEPAALRRQLVRLGEAASAVGRDDVARRALARAVTLDPRHCGARRAFGELLFTQEAWHEARVVLERVLDAEEDSLPRDACVELHYRVGRCALELSDAESARLHIETALALDPAHRPSLLVHAELDADDPIALLADKLALANTAPPEERASLLAAIGDFYADEMGDNVSAREIYREALLHRPSDHVLLTKCLGVTAEEGDWRHSLDLVERLIQTEGDGAIRARYRHVAAMICRDELASPDEAVELLVAAVADAPELTQAADELEALLRERKRIAQLAQFYYQRLDQMRQLEVRPGERLRLWDRLAEVCAELGEPADAACAYEVGIELEPSSVGRRQELADIYLVGDQHDKAIDQHQQILVRSKRRLASYEALQRLYTETGQAEKAAACADALALIGMRPVEVRERVPTARPMLMADDGLALSGADYRELAMGDVDPLLTSLFARVAPAFAVERARPRLSGRKALRPGDPRPAARAFRYVTDRLGIDAPAAHVKREQAATCTISLRQTGAVLAPVATIGRSALSGGIDEREIVFELARHLVDLRSDRFARLLCPRAEELTQIVELAVALGTTDDPRSLSDISHTARWLAATLRPVDLDQLITIGERLAERATEPERAALDWLETTERVADRVGYLLAGDLATCVRVLEREPAARLNKHDRILDLIWSSVTEPVFSVRAHLERWSFGRGAASDRNYVA